MNYNEKKLLQVFEDLKSIDHLDSFVVDVEGIFSFLDRHLCYEYFYGASKVVIVPQFRDNADYVIKIPFDRLYDEEDEETTPLECANDNKLHKWDYCYNELLRYHIAKQNNYEHLFAKVKLLGKVGKFPIYLQKKVINSIDYFDTIGKTPSKENYNRIKTSLTRKGFYSHINIDWLYSVEEEYGTKYMLDFVEFLYINGWDDDLSASNVGYTISDHKPVIFDYAGFKD